MKVLFVGALLTFSYLESFSQDLRYSLCENCWSPDSLGNHRAVMDVMTAGKVARAVIPWRRRDYLPDGKNLLVTDRVGNIISNVMRISIHREEADIIFEPRSGAGQYYLYFMKYWTKGRSNYPVVIYPPYKDTADPKWIESIKGVPPVPTMVLEIQSIDELSSFYPMEVIATNVEMTRLTERNKTAEFLVFPEDRLHPVKMKTDLPQRWIQRGPQDFFSAEVLKGENFSFQLGVFAHKKKLENVTVKFSDLKGATDVIPAASISCINTSGINWDGTSFEKKVDIAQANVQPLWCVVTIPESLSAGEYTGSAIIQAAGMVAKTIAIRLKIAEKLVLNGGVDEPWKQTRLTWLNSQVGANDEVIAPYLPLELKGNSISLLGRKLEVGEMGLPKQITTYFSPEMTKLQAEGKQLLSAGFEFSAISKDKGPVQWTNSKQLEYHASPGAVTWTSENISEPLKLETEGRLEFDGFANFKIKLTALHDVDLEDMGLSMPVEKYFSKYMMGLGHKGGLRPSSFSWTWDVANKNQDGAWIGNINGGIQFSLRAENYSRPLNTNFYLQKPLVLPPSWGNAGKGGVQISEVGNGTSVRAFSGPRSMKAGETLYYNFTLLITPFHTLDTDFQWRTRFYHQYSPVDTIVKRGATVVNIHHANAINPFINYPFIRTKEMKTYIDEAHGKGLKVKIYNTVRELSNHAYETPVLRSLGTEIYSTGKGGGFSWLQEHLVDDYIAAWFVPELKDAAVINSGMSRWHNYYVEGIRWLVQNIGIDGIYLDDVAFDRTTMKRIRRVLQSERGPGIIDLHSANQFNKRDGFNNSANLYLEHFPYLNRLWFGEYFDYDSKPDFWITEVSGIPFGLMGEMLEKGGNPWRGMIYGMTNRMPWGENSDPRHLWKLWDDFGMQSSEMIGYWVEKNPVKTDNQEVLATVYRKKDAVLVAVASWATDDAMVKLNIDWKALGLKPGKVMEVPEIKDFQAKQSIPVDGKFLVPKGKGLLIVVR